jgi:hypothetical protein
MVYEQDCFYIHEDKYTELVFSQFLDMSIAKGFEEESLGLKFISINENGVLTFKIINEQKFVFSRLKYNI